MIWAAFAWFRALPRGWHYLAGAVALLLTAWVWHLFAVRGAVRADREQAASTALQTARDADAASVGAREATRNEVEQTNADARDAANRSDDPLRAALDSLREGAGGN